MIRTSLYSGEQAKSTVLFGKHATFATTNDQVPTQVDIEWPM